MPWLTPAAMRDVGHAGRGVAALLEHGCAPRRAGCSRVRRPRSVSGGGLPLRDGLLEGRRHDAVLVAAACPTGMLDDARAQVLAEALGLRVEARRVGDAAPEQAVDHDVDRAQVGQRVHLDAAVRRRLRAAARRTPSVDETASRATPHAAPVEPVVAGSGDPEADVGVAALVADRAPDDRRRAPPAPARRRPGCRAYCRAGLGATAVADAAADRCRTASSATTRRRA